MGGPAAWKDMQRKRNEWGRSSGFDEPPAGHGETSGDEEERKKRDMYAEYDVDDDEPVNEKATEGSDDDEVGHIRHILSPTLPPFSRIQPDHLPPLTTIYFIL